jgi:hypothetical protein
MALRIEIVRSHSSAGPRRRRRWTVVAATLVAGVLVTGVSYAYWTATGTGTASVGSTTAVGIGVSNIATPLADLYPGKIDGLSFVLTNPNPYNVQVKKITALSVASSDITNCPISNVTINSAYSPIPAAGYNLTPTTVNANNGTATITLPSFITMNLGALDGCQTKTFTVTMTVTGDQI